MTGSHPSSTAALARLTRLFRLRGGEAPGQPLTFMVDGAAIRAEAADRGVRLSCQLGAPPRDEAELRRLMRRFLAHADRGAETLCVDAEGQLALVAELADDAELDRLAALFCDAAVHWSAQAGGQSPAGGLGDELAAHRMHIIRP
jgi:hypothetical protein